MRSLWSIQSLLQSVSWRMKKPGFTRCILGLSLWILPAGWSCSWLVGTSSWLAGELCAAFAAATGAVARKRRRVVNFCWVSFCLVVAAVVCVIQTEVACTAAVMHRSLVAAFSWVNKAVEGWCFGSMPLCQFANLFCEWACRWQACDFLCLIVLHYLYLFLCLFDIF